MNIFSMRLKYLRERSGKTQKEVAEQIGLSQAGYGKIELGQREPNLETLHRIRHFFNESLDFIIGYHVEDLRAETLYEYYYEARRDREEYEEEIASVSEYLDEKEENLHDRIKIMMEYKDNLKQMKLREEAAFNLFFEHILTIPGSHEEFATKDYWIERYNKSVEDRNRINDEFLETYNKLGNQ